MLSQSLALRQTVELRLTLPFDNTGDIPLFSLHRIKHRYTEIPAAPEVRKSLFQYLLDENAFYQRETGTKRYCITLGHLETATSNLEDHLLEQIERVFKLEENSTLPATVKKLFSGKAEQTVTTIRDWFDKNYDILRYNTEGNIPWPVVQTLRQRLSLWALGQTDVVDEPIEDLLADAARLANIDPRQYDAAELYKALRRNLG